MLLLGSQGKTALLHVVLCDTKASFVGCLEGDSLALGIHNNIIVVL